MSFADLLINTCTVKRESQVSIVIGTDGNDYYCFLAHTAADADRPTDGANYATYWKVTGGTGEGAIWVLGTVYALSKDAYGNPIVDWLDHLTNQDCRLMAGSGREIMFGAEVVIADYKLFIADVDITEQDRVEIDNITYEVLLVADRQDSAITHHKECLMRTVR